jgi:hypothetical protein
VDVDHVAPHVGVAVADLVEDREAGDQPAGSREEQLEDVELLGRQLDLGGSAMDAARLGVERQVADPQWFVVLVRALRRSARSRATNSSRSKGLSR